MEACAKQDRIKQMKQNLEQILGMFPKEKMDALENYFQFNVRFIENRVCLKCEI